MIKRKMIKKIIKLAASAVFISVCFSAVPRITPVVPVYAETPEELEEIISNIEQENEEIDSQIAEYNVSISESEELQALAWEKLNNQKEQLDAINNKIYYKELEVSAKADEISAKESEIYAKQNEINDKQGEIDAKQGDIDELSGNIQSTEQDIENTKIRISDLEEQNQKKVDEFGELVAVMSISENTDIISVLAGSTDFVDFLIRNDMMNRIAEQNKEFMDSVLADINELNEMRIGLEGKVVQLENDRKKLEEDKVSLENDRTALENDKAALEGEKAVLESEKQKLLDQKASLENDYYESAALSNQYNSDYNTYSTQISNFEYMQDQLAEQKKANAAEIAAYQAQIQEIIRLAQQNSQQEYEEGDWRWPLDSNFTRITTYFGYDDWRGGNHSGIDISNAGINGANIYASKGGTVIKAVTSYIAGYSYGMYVVIDHGDGYSTLYGHCSAVYVYEGQQVSKGDVIAAVGSTGWSTGPHLHFEVRLNSVAQNPFNYVSQP